MAMYHGIVGATGFQNFCTPFRTLFLLQLRLVLT